MKLGLRLDMPEKLSTCTLTLNTNKKKHICIQINDNTNVLKFSECTMTYPSPARRSRELDTGLFLLVPATPNHYTPDATVLSFQSIDCLIPFFVLLFKLIITVIHVEIR